jgi:WD40 repeat protein
MYTARYAPQGDLLATAHLGGVVRIWDAGSLTLLNAFSAQELYRYGTIDFSPDGLWLATGSDHREGQFVRLWDPLSGDIVWDTGRHQGDIYTVGFGKDNTTLVSGAEDGTCYLWDLHPPEKLPETSLPELWKDLGSEDSKTAYLAMWAFAEKPQESLRMLGEKLRAINKVIDLNQLNPDLSPEEAERRQRLRKILVDKEPQTESLLTVRRAMSVLQQIDSPESQKLLEDLAANHPLEDIKRATHRKQNPKSESRNPKQIQNSKHQ